MPVERPLGLIPGRARRARCLRIDCTRFGIRPTVFERVAEFAGGWAVATPSFLSLQTG
jgi:hypothetical protein